MIVVAGAINGAIIEVSLDHHLFADAMEWYLHGLLFHAFFGPTDPIF